MSGEKARENDEPEEREPCGVVENQRGDGARARLNANQVKKNMGELLLKYSAVERARSERQPTKIPRGGLAKSGDVMTLEKMGVCVVWGAVKLCITGSYQRAWIKTEKRGSRQPENISEGRQWDPMLFLHQEKRWVRTG